METSDIRWLLKRAREHPERAAVVSLPGEEKLTYAQLGAKSLQAVSYLRHAGLVAGDRVAVLAENHLGYYILLGAAQLGGFCLVPLNYRLTPSEIGSLLADAEPKLVLYQHQFLDKLPTNSASWQQQELDSWLADLQKLPPAEPTDHQDPDAAIMLLYTSGSTGQPKGVLYTHRMLYYNALNTVERLGISASERALDVMPPFHTGGWHVLPTPTLFAGGTVYSMVRFEADEVLKAIAKYSITLFMAVPTMCRLLAQSSGFTQADLRSLRFVVVGGEALALTLLEDWHQKGIAMRQGYGLTEAGPSITSLPETDAIRKRGSIGTPNRYAQLRLVRSDGNLSAPNEPGELQLAGPVVTPGYWRQSETTAASFTADSWLQTGDIARADEEGYLYIVDRIKNLYISGGENVYPAEVEVVLSSHPAVAAIAIIGVPDEQWGEVGLAFVVLGPGATLTIEQLTGFGREHLASYKMPRHLYVLETLPLQATGKIDRRALSTLATQLGYFPNE